MFVALVEVLNELLDVVFFYNKVMPVIQSTYKL